MKQEYTIVKGLRNYTGLMFRTKKTKPLVFTFNKPVLIPIHSYFVFFSFKARWYDEYDILIEEQIIKPFSKKILPQKPFVKLVEIPIQ